MKRAAEKQITQEDNGDDDGDELQGTGFQAASAEALSGRKIRGLPKRKGTGAPSDTDTTPKPSFGGFSGFGSTQPATTNGATDTSAPKPVSFSAFSGFGATSTPATAPAASKPALTFSAPPPTTNPTAPSKTSQLFGSVIGSASTSEKPTLPFGFGSTTATTSASTSSLPAKQDVTSKSAEFYESLRGLNRSLVVALEDAIAKDAFANLPLESIAKAYAQYRKTIEDKATPPKPAAAAPSVAAEPAKVPPSFSLPKPPAGGFFGQKAPESSPAPTTSAAPPLPFSFGAPKPTPAEAANGTAPKPPVFNFGAVSKPADAKPAQADDSGKPATKPVFNFGTPSASVSFGGASAPNPFAFKPVDKTASSAPSGPSGMSNLFGAKPAEADSEKKPEEKKSLYPFGMLESKSSTPSPAPPVKPPFFSFGSTPATTPVHTPGTPDPAEKKPAMSFGGFGSTKGFSFGAATPGGGTPSGGSLGNPVGFAFGSPPKDPFAAGAVTPSPATTAGLEAATAAANPLMKPASTVASLAGSDLASSRADTPATEPSAPAPAEDDIEGEGEENETNVFNERAKLYRFKQNSWVDMGVGRFKLKKHKETGAQRILMRTEHGRVLLNFRMHGKLDAQPAGKPTIIKFTGHDEGQPALFQVRFKAPETTATVLKHLQDASKE